MTIVQQAAAAADAVKKASRASNIPITVQLGPTAWATLGSEISDMDSTSKAMVSKLKSDYAKGRVTVDSSGKQFTLVKVAVWGLN